MTSQTNGSLRQSQRDASMPLGCNACQSHSHNTIECVHALQLQDLVDIKIKVDLPSVASRNRSAESGDSADASADCDEMVNVAGRNRSENYYVFSNCNSNQDKDSQKEARPAASKASWVESQAADVRQVLENNIRKH